MTQKYNGSVKQFKNTENFVDLHQLERNLVDLEKELASARLLVDHAERTGREEILSLLAENDKYFRINWMVDLFDYLIAVVMLKINVLFLRIILKKILLVFIQI